MLGAAGGMAEIAVELEIARRDPGRGQGFDDIGRDLWWKQRVGAAQDVEHLGLDPGEIRPSVEAEQGAAQDDQRVGVPFRGPLRGLLADRRLACCRVGETRRQGGLDAVALQRLDPDVGQHRLARRLAVIAAAMPLGIAGKPRLQFGQLLVGIDRGPGRGVDRHDRVHEIGVGDRPLKRLVAAIGGTGDRDQMADDEMVELGLDQDACELVQFRPAVVAPRGEARADIDIVFDLAVRLGLGNQFWHGDVEAALDHHLAPSDISVAALRANPRGIRVPLETTYEKYRGDGFATPSGKVEIFSTALQAIGEPPLPEFRAPFSTAPGFPLTLTSAKTPLYCHSQHRNLAKLRRLEPDPIAEISPPTATARDIGEGDWLAITTPRGRVRARAHLNTTLADGILAARHGWWQACPELDLPGYDALDADGANVNLAIGAEAADPVSGAAPHRCYPCEIEKLAD